MASYSGRRRRRRAVVSDQDQARRALALAHQCPYCRAGAKKRCSTRAGRVREVPHAARMRLVGGAAIDGRVSEQVASRAGRRRRDRVRGAAIGAVVVAGAGLFSFHDSAADPEWLVTPTPPSVERTIVGWEPLHCADGWTSTSIGKQGACSHHGGVVGGAIYDSKTVPAVEGVLAPERTDWGLVAARAFWSLLLGGIAGLLLWARLAES